jgi:hypothetical protein
MTEQIPMEVLDAIREALEETARRFAKAKCVPAPAPAASEPATDPEHDLPPGRRPHWHFI